MNTPPKIPQFGQAPIIGQRQQQMKMQINAAIGQLATQVYSQLAVAHIGTRDEHQSVDRDHLRRLAKEAQTAGKCYFEGLGVIEQEKGESE